MDGRRLVVRSLRVGLLVAALLWVGAAGAQAATVSIATGGFHTCALKGDATVACWGYNSSGQAPAVPAVTGVTQLAAGGFHTCALKGDGTVACWGNNSDGQAPAVPAVTGVTQIAAGNSHTCALKNDGTVACWGDNFFGQAPAVPAVTGVTEIAAGNSHACALKNDGTVACWGNNSDGQAPAAPAVTGVTQLAAGGYHTCAVRGDGTVGCWGYNGNGQTSVPQGLRGTVALAAGGFHTCALDGDATVACWGYNFFGQAPAVAAVTGVTQLAAGDSHTCALKGDGTVACWGSNSAGQAPAVPAVTGVTQLAAGDSHTCALKTNATVACWGRNLEGQAPAVAAVTGVTQLAAGSYHTCALKTDGTVACWGYNSSGQAPAVPAVTGVTQITAGLYHTCALKNDGTVACWGSNSSGQAPAVPAVTGVTQITAGDSHTCALKNDATVACWGYNGAGQAPAVPAVTGVTELAAGDGHTCALKNDATVACWGSNSYGQAPAAPGVVTGAVPAAVYGSPFEHALERSGSPAPAIHRLGGALPPGVALDSATGELAGTPTRAGSFTVWVAAFNALGASLGQAVTIDVARAPLTSTATDHAISYGTPRPALGASVTGLVLGDTRADALTREPTCTAAGAATRPAAGSYPISCAGATAENYAIAYQPGTLTVKRAALTIRANDKQISAGDPLPVLDATVTGLLAGDTLNTPATCKLAGAVAGPGSYPISCSGAGDPNYAIAYKPGTLTVNARPAQPAQALTLTTRRIVVIKRSTRSLQATCTLDQPRLDGCTLVLKAGKRTLATVRAGAGADNTSATITLPLSSRASKLARRPGGQPATLQATATQISGPDLQATIALLLLPSAVVSAPTDGLFDSASAKLPRRGTPYLRRLRALLTDAAQISCTGHTDNRGNSASNQKLGLQRAKAVCAFLTRDTNIKTRANSQGETHPRAPNTTANGRARNRYVSIQVRY